jgi:TetR/AcrR family transcriptional regulator, cholesterol catabolism regulator
LPSRRQEILGIAAELFSKNGVQNTSMRDLADAAGILPSSLYSHFKSKEALADEILRQYLEDFRERCRQIDDSDASPVDRLRGLIRVTLEGADAFPAALIIFHRDLNYLASLPRFDYLFDLYLNVRDIWIRAITEAMNKGELNSDVEPVIYFRWMRDALTMTSRWHQPGGTPTIDTLATYAEQVFLRGMANNEQRPLPFQ